MHPKRSPWLFVPTLYFQQGLPVILVQQTSVLLYKNLGISNAQIGLWTSLIAWPWFLKMLWGPWVDTRGSKRGWVLANQVLISAALALMGFAVTSPHFFGATLALFGLTAVLSATHDIALDGYYMVALPKDKQALFIGVTSTFFRLAMVFGNGALVVLAGYLEARGWSTPESWRFAFLFAAAIYGLLMLYAFGIMPRAALDRAVAPSELQGRSPLGAALRTFFTQPKIIPILLFILFYRFAESMLTKMTGPFLLDPASKGGLALDTVQVGMILGNVGVVALIAGGMLGGTLISRFGLRRCVIPMVAVMTAPNLLYVWAALTRPGSAAVYLITATEYFGYGFGMASYMVFTMYICQGSPFATSHYAIVTGLMALGGMLAGVASGFLQQALGYVGFFWVVCLATIPGIILLRWVPLGAAPREMEGELVPAGSH